MAVVDERTLCARFKSWIDAELQATPYGTLTRAENEVHASPGTTCVDVVQPRRTGVDDVVNEQAVAFVEAKQRELREALAERIDGQDSAFADAFVQSLSRLAAAVRTALHAG